MQASQPGSPFWAAHCPAAYAWLFSSAAAAARPGSTQASSGYYRQVIFSAAWTQGWAGSQWAVADWSSGSALLPPVDDSYRFQAARERQTARHATPGRYPPTPADPYNRLLRADSQTLTGRKLINSGWHSERLPLWCQIRHIAETVLASPDGTGVRWSWCCRAGFTAASGACGATFETCSDEPCALIIIIGGLGWPYWD